MSFNNNISEEEFESIEQYLLNTLSDSENAAFEQRLITETDLRQKVEDVKALLHSVELEALKENLNRFHADLIQTPNSSKSHENTFSRSLPWYRTYAVAASVILILGLSSLWYFNQSNSAQLYDSYFSPDPGLPTTMSTQSNYEFYEAMVYYKQGDYTSAIQKWNTILESKSKNDTLNYFLGVAHLADNNETKAIQYLKPLASSSVESTFKNDTYHYLALAYLKSGNIELAKKYLTFSTLDNSKALLSELND